MFLSLKSLEQFSESLTSLRKEKKVSLLKERNKNGHISRKDFRIYDCDRAISS
jgi:hypothetical protein